MLDYQVLTPEQRAQIDRHALTEAEAALRQAELQLVVAQSNLDGTRAQVEALRKACDAPVPAE